MLNSMFVNPDLWRRYFNDFVSYKLNLAPQTDMKGALPPGDDVAQCLLRAYFGQLHEFAAPKRLAQLHCYIRVYQLQLAQTCSLLRPLSKVKEVSERPSPAPTTDRMAKHKEGQFRRRLLVLTISVSKGRGL